MNDKNETIHENLIRDYLPKYGYFGKKQDDYVRAFDLKQPVYLNTPEPGADIYQFVRVASASHPCPPLGNCRHRGKFGLIRKGTGQVVGVARLDDVSGKG